MPFDATFWKENIIRYLGQLEDEGFQRRLWGGVGPNSSTPEETINRFYDTGVVEAVKKGIDALPSDAHAALTVSVWYMDQLCAQRVARSYGRVCSMTKDGQRSEKKLLA